MLGDQQGLVQGPLMLGDQQGLALSHPSLRDLCCAPISAPFINLFLNDDLKIPPS